jgi:hypothetical protein
MIIVFESVLNSVPALYSIGGYIGTMNRSKLNLLRVISCRSSVSDLTENC